MNETEGYIPARKTDDVGLVLVVVQVGIALAVLYAIFVTKPKAPPPASDLKGCFVAAKAPTIRFDGKLLHFDQAGEAPAHYRLAWRKNGTIDIVTDEPLSLLPLGSRYVYQRGEQQTIVFGRLAHTIDGKRYGVSKARDAEYLEIMSPGAADIDYNPASVESCKA